MHKLLVRQIKKYFGKEAEFDGVMAAFLNEIDRTYESAQKERDLLENALETSSKELIDANKRLKESSEETINLQRSALDAAANMIVITDEAGKIKYANKSFCDFTMYGLSEVLGRTPNFLNSGMHSKQFFENMWEKIKKGEVFEGEVMNKKKNGDIYIEEIVVTPIKDQKTRTITHFVAIKKDITERRAQEEELRCARDKALEASRLKSEFLSTMSHEIRTPMNGVIGMTDILLQTDLDGDQLEYVNAVKESSNTLLVIINDILDFSKIEAGKLDIEYIDINLVDIVENVADILAPRAKEKGVAFMTYIDGRINAQMKSDPIRIKQILTNLATNAVKFTNMGEVSIKVKPIFGGGKIEKIRFEVIDTGIGISKNTIGELFRSFTQADGSTTRKYGGTGLGLAISKNLCKLMGGEIGVESEIGKGSTFWFELPFVVGSKMQPTPKKHKAAIDSLQNKKQARVDESKTTKEDFTITDRSKKEIKNSGTIKILLVEDNLINQKVGSLTLKKIGYAVTIAQNGEEALAALEKESFDAILMDCQMPIMDGFEATARIRARKDAKSATPIIAITANAIEGDKERCLAAGMDDYISKPINQKEIVEKIAIWSVKNSKFMAKEEAPESFLKDPIDIERLRNIFDGDMDIIRSVVESSIESIETNATKSLFAAENKDIKKMKQLSHDIKGEALSMGLQEVATIIMGIEPSLDNITFHDLRYTMISLKKALSRAFKFLEENSPN